MSTSAGKGEGSKLPCPCKNKKRETYKVKLPGGMTVTRTTQEAATAYAAKHPGSTVTKVPAKA